MVPRWMAAAAHREQVGDLLALISDKIDGVSVVVEAVPAIEIDDPAEIGGFSPFGRDDVRTRCIQTRRRTCPGFFHAYADEEPGSVVGFVLGGTDGSSDLPAASSFRRRTFPLSDSVEVNTS